MTINHDLLVQVAHKDDLDWVAKQLDADHVKVGANTNKAWFFKGDWDHIIAKVVRYGHQHYKLKNGHVKGVDDRHLAEFARNLIINMRQAEAKTAKKSHKH